MINTKIIISILLVVLITAPVTTATLTHGQQDKTTLKTENALTIGKGSRYNIQGLIYVHIEGAPYERGFQHGYLLSGEIIDMITRWSNIIHNMPVIGSFTGTPGSAKYYKTSEKWWEFCKTRAMKIYWNDYPPEYQQEIKGIADGVNAKDETIFERKVTYEDILTLNEMYEFMSRLLAPHKSIHPFRSLFYSIKSFVPNLPDKEETTFISTMVVQPPAHHCSGFVATGNATTHGQMVISDSVWFGNWWFSYYIAQRWNVILDVVPDNGNRFIIGTSPGYIWSDEDFYQNEKGIAFIETTCPQGVWRDKGLPLAVRARNAAQYGDSVDDVIYYLTHNSDGIMNAVWLIGDAKTGEIARLEAGLYVYSVQRTFNGFYWSANNPMDIRVRSEELRLESIYKGRVYQLLHLLLKTEGYQYYTREYRPSNRDIKFEELGKEYYGRIDTEVVKKIMSTPPIVDMSSDCKITDSYLIKRNGLWVFWGNPGGKIWDAEERGLKNVYPDIADRVEPAGWVRLFGLPVNRDYKIPKPKENYRDPLLNVQVEWSIPVGNETNDVSPNLIVYKNNLYTALSGTIQVLDASTGAFQWQKTFGEQVTKPVIDNDVIAVGSDTGVHVFTSDGETMWDNILDERVVSVSMGGKLLAAGTYTGNLYLFEKLSGNEIWHKQVSNGYPAYVLVDDGNIIVCSGEKCMLFKGEEGTLSWSMSFDAPLTTQPLLNSDTLYVGGWDTCLHAISVKNGDEQWSFETGWGIDSTPVEKDGVIYLSSLDNNLYAVDAESGNELWHFSTKAAVHDSPLVYGDYVFIGSDDGRFYALDKTNGTCQWSFAPKYTINNDVYNYVTTPLTSSAAAYDGIVYVGAAGHIYTLDAHTIEKPPSESKAAGQPLSVELWLFIVFPIIIILLILALYLYKTRK
ncbi:MAG: hypothetical protein DRN01_01130 [Thermoplasmata archaeon]|nr:MAG: hypothetical protein DRN01_01130 [Thermoplasmata archaeon]